VVGLILKEKERKMKKLILVGLFLGTIFLNANEQTGKELYAKCAGCHGQDGKMKALGKATPLRGQASASLFKKMLAYKEGTRNVNGMSGFMKGQVSSFSRLEMLKISNYISDPSIPEKEITECFEDSDHLWKKLEQKYKQEIEEHSGGDETAKYIEKKACFKVDNERMMVALYVKDKQEHKHFASFLLAKIDRENKIVESRLFKDVFMFNYLTTTLTIDSKSYIKYSPSKPFGIVVEEELDGPPTLSKKKLFIYESDGLKPILSNLTIEEYDEEMAGHNLARVASLKTTKINSDYAPLIFSHNYSYAFDGIKEKWKVKLDDIECLYKNEKYECKVNPVFELRQVEKNVKKGLKYRIIVLHALLDEVLLSKENLETYNSIVYYLKKYKHEKEAHFLEDQILYKFPKEKSLAQVENLEEKRLFWNEQITIDEFVSKELNVSFRLLGSYDDNSYSQSLQWKDIVVPSDIEVQLGRIHFKNKNEFYVENLYEYGFSIIQFKNDEIHFLATDEDIIEYNENEFFKFVIDLKDDKPIFYFKSITKKLVFDFTEYKPKVNDSTKEARIYFDDFDKYGNIYGEKYLSEKKVQKIKKSNKSYQIYQKLNKYDIFLMLVISSDNIKPWRKHTNLKYFHLIEEDMSDGVISSMVYIDKEGRGFAEDEPASLGVIAQFDYNVKSKKLTETITDNKDLRQQNFDSVWADIMDIYLFDKQKKYLFIKEKSYLYKKPNSKSKSEKFLINNDCALILDKTSNGWYKVFYYHPHWHTNTIMWINFDVEKHGLIG